MNKSNAGMILALGICSLVVCALLGPVAWSMGKTELARIDAGQVDGTDRSWVQAGYVCGIISTVLMAVGAIFLLFFMIAQPMH